MSDGIIIVSFSLLGVENVYGFSTTRRIFKNADVLAVISGLLLCAEIDKTK